MATQEKAKRGFWLSGYGLLLLAALISSAVAWWMIAWPVATFSNLSAHQGHFVLTFAHMVGGTGMLFLGGLNLYLAARKDKFALHRRVGLAYLLLGAFGAIMAIAINFSPAHKAADGPLLTNVNIATSMLALAWLGFAAVGWRAGRNKQFAIHADCMIRSYVLVWSFVLCRIVSRVSEVDDMGGGQSFIWLSWIGPLLLCELVLQWRKGSKRRPQA